MSLIDERFNQQCTTVSDINEHLPILKKYASECSHITELGVRAIVSTWAFLSGRPKKLVSVDIYHPNHFGANLDEVYKVCKEENILFDFIQDSSLEIEIESTDLLFIDTIHWYAQLSKELKLHSNKVRKYIILHDTTSCYDDLQPAIDEFLNDNKNWTVDLVLTSNSGLTVLRRNI